MEAELSKVETLVDKAMIILGMISDCLMIVSNFIGCLTDRKMTNEDIAVVRGVIKAELAQLRSMLRTRASILNFLRTIRTYKLKT